MSPEPEIVMEITEVDVNYTCFVCEATWSGKATYFETDRVFKDIQTECSSCKGKRSALLGIQGGSGQQCLT